EVSACTANLTSSGIGASLGTAGKRSEPALGEQGVDGRFAPAELAIERHRVGAVAARIDRLEPRGERWVERVAGLGKGGITVIVEHRGPQIGVISGGIAAAGEQMLEMRRAVPQPDLLRHSNALAEIALERADIVDSALFVEFEVEHRAGRVLDRVEALVEIAPGEELFQKRVGQRVTRLEMPSIALQVFRHGNPVLEDLRRKLDKVAPHRGARLRGVFDTAQQPMQPVTEFVEESA